MSIQFKTHLVWTAMLREGHVESVLVAQTPFGRAVVDKQGDDWVCIEHPLGENYPWLNSKFRHQSACLNRATKAYYRNLAQAIQEATL